MGFPGAETSISRVTLRVISIIAAVALFIAVGAGVSSESIPYGWYIFMGLSALWSLINLIFLCCKCAPHPGFCIAFDIIASGFTAFCTVTAGVSIAFNDGEYGSVYRSESAKQSWLARSASALAFAIIAFIAHFTLFVVACIDVDKRRRTAPGEMNYKASNNAAEMYGA